MAERYDPSWEPILKPLFRQDYMRSLSTFVQHERKQTLVFPPENLVLNAFRLTLDEVIKVVVVGQDPRHHDVQSHGLAISVPKGIAASPSRKKIYTGP